MSQQEQVAEEMEMTAGVQADFPDTSHPTSGDTVLKCDKYSEGSSRFNISSEIQDLSPDTQNCLRLLVKSIKHETAELDMDAQGHIKVDYKKTKKLRWDASRANIIDVPKSDKDMHEKVEATLEMIEYLKIEKPPSGVVVDGTKINISKKKEYREGFEFIKMKRVLGSGNCAGDIIVVKDTKYKTEHAQKTMMISYFRGDEVRCWVDLSESGYVPSLYLFKIDNNKVTIHMEILRHAITLRSIIDDHMTRIHKADPCFVKPFSLSVLNGSLDAVTAMHSKGWVHKDLHAGNAMVQKVSPSSLKVKVIDFGLASRLYSDITGLDIRGFQADIAQIVRLFTALYTGEEFDNVQDLHKNWESKLANFFASVSETDRDELVCLLDAALKIIDPDDVPKFKESVQGSLDKAMGDKETCDDIMKRVIAVLYSETSDSPYQQQAVVTPEIEVDGPLPARDVADSKVTVYHDNGNRHHHSSHDNERFHRVGLGTVVTMEMLDKFRFSISIKPSPPNSPTS